ncbi:MAG: discoidin domain-containing protein, partial [Methanopyri archaeon]|nr:discoidin domain-containing protein [Methanopyri archaeon]
MDTALFPRLEIVTSLLSDDNIAKNKFANRKIDVDSRAIVSGQSVACGYHPLKPTYEDIPDDITQLTDGIIMETGNGWRSLVADNGNWIQVDLEEPMGVSGMRLYAFKEGDDIIMKPGNFEIHVSNDTEVYELIDEYVWELDAEETLVGFDQPITARYFAIVVVSDVINGQFAANTDQVVDEDGDIVLATGETVSEALSGLSEIEIFSIRQVADDLEAFVKLADGTKKLLERYSPSAWAFDEEAFLAFNDSSAAYLASPTSTQMIDTVLLTGVDPNTTEYTCPGGEGEVLPAALLEPTGGAGKRKVVMHEFPLDLSAFRLYDLELSYWSGREHCEVDLEGCEVFNSTRETELLILDNAVYVDTVDEPYSIGLGNGTGIITDNGLFEISVSDTAVYPGEFIEVFVRFTPSTETETEKLLFSTRLDNVTDDLMADGFRNLLHFRMDKEEVKKRVQISGCFWADIVSVQITSHMTDAEEDELSGLQEEFGTSAVQTRERLGGIVKGVPYNATFTFRASTLHNNGARSDLPHTWLLRADVLNSFIGSDGSSFLPKEVVIPIRIYKEGLEDKEEESCVPGCLGDQLISLEVCKGLSLLCTHYIRDFFAMTTILKDYYIKAQNALDEIDEFAKSEDAFLNIQQGTTGLERGPSRPVDLNLEVPALKRIWTDQIIDKERISKWLSDVMLGLARGQQSAEVGEMDTRETLAFWDKMMPENQQWALERYEVCKVKMKSLGKFSCLEFDGFKKMKENSKEAFEAAKDKYGVPYNQVTFWNGIQYNLDVTFDPVKKENKPKEVFEACIDAECGVKQQTLALDDGADVVLSGTRLTLQS